MRFFSIAIFAAASALGASALEVEERQIYRPCSGLYGSAQCCATDVLGLVNLDCEAPPESFTSADEFSSVCAAEGLRARCCVLPILDQGVLCNTPAGVDD